MAKAGAVGQRGQSRGSTARKSTNASARKGANGVSPLARNGRTYVDDPGLARL